MLLFNKLIPEKIYRINSTFTLPYNKTNSTKGNLVTVLSEDVKDTVDFLNSKYITTKAYYRYYIERIMTVKVLGQLTRIRNDQKEIFEDAFKDNNLNINLMVNPSTVKDFNVIYELGQYIDTINKNEKLKQKSLLIKAEKKFEFIVEKLKQVDSLFHHPEKYLYIPVHNYIENPKDATLFTKRINMENLLVIFCKMIEQHHSTLSRDFKDWTLVFMNVNELFYIRFEDMNEGTLETIKTLFKKFRSRKNKVDETLDEESLVGDAEVVKEDLDMEVSNELEDIQLDPKVKKRISHKVDSNIKDLAKDKEIKDIEEVEKEVSSKVQKDVKKELDLLMSDKSTSRIARIKKMQNEMQDLKLEDKTIEELKLAAEIKTIDESNFKANVINKDMTNMKFNNFDKGYKEKLLNHDISNVLTSFQYMDKPLYLIKLDVEDTSTSIDKKYTYKCVYEDENGQRHHMTFDIPKIIGDKFIHLNKSDKLFITQIVPLPVTKTCPDIVQVSSNYNKLFITRFGQNLSPKIVKFNKILPTISDNIVKTRRGNNLKTNKEYLTTLEYDELSSKYSLIDLDGGRIKIYLNQDEIREMCHDKDLKFDREKEFPFAIVNNDNNLELLTVDIQTDKIHGTNDSPIDFIIKEISDIDQSFKEEFIRVGASKRYIFTRVKIMNNNVPLVLLLSFLIGFQELLDKLESKYEFTETKPSLKNEDSINKSVIEFSDGYLVFDNTNFSNSLILNGMNEIPTKEYSFFELSGKDVYYNIFEDLYGRKNIGKAFENFNQLFIDPITKEVLEDYNLPTNFVDLIIYANSLLDNNAYDLEGDFKNYRIRTNEMMVAHLYKTLSEAYENYRVTADYKNPQKFSIKKNAVITAMMESQVFEEYSVLNPIFEIERMRSTSFKGISGCNMARAFSIEKRSYNESMLGILAQSSPISQNIGISRVLSIDPKIASLRGYIEAGSKEDADNLKSTELLSGAELLVPMSCNKDDAQRVSMMSIQSRHTIASIDSDVPLFGYGFDKVLAHTISDRFAFKAKGSGTVKEINEKLQYMMLEYDDGTKDVVDLSNRQEKNAG